jgi:hypothetical protein
VLLSQRRQNAKHFLMVMENITVLEYRALFREKSLATTYYSSFVIQLSL